MTSAAAGGTYPLSPAVERHVIPTSGVSFPARTFASSAQGSGSIPRKGVCGCSGLTWCRSGRGAGSHRRPGALLAEGWERKAPGESGRRCGVKPLGVVPADPLHDGHALCSPICQHDDAWLQGLYRIRFSSHRRLARDQEALPQRSRTVIRLGDGQQSVPRVPGRTRTNVADRNGRFLHNGGTSAPYGPSKLRARVRASSHTPVGTPGQELGRSCCRPLARAASGRVTAR